MRVLREAGRSTPDQVGVVGFGDTPAAAYTHASLSSIRQDVKRGAEVLISSVLQVAAGEAVESTELPVALVIRGSTLQA